MQREIGIHEYMCEQALRYDMEVYEVYEDVARRCDALRENAERQCAELREALRNKDEIHEVSRRCDEIRMRALILSGEFYYGFGDGP